MTQDPGQWGPQGGYPPQGQGGYPPQQPPPPGYPPQPQPAYSPQGTYAPQGGYPPQGQPGGYGQPGQQLPPGGYGPQVGGVPPGGYPPQGAAQPAKKSAGLIIGIVVAAVVLLAAIGGIIMVLNRDSGGQPPVSITPSDPVPPTDQPTPGPTDQPTTQPSTEQPTDSPQPTPTQGTQSGSVDLGKGISLTPASGWEVQKTGNGVAQLSNGQSVFLGQVIQAEAATNPGQLCDAWHRKVAEDTSNGKFAEPKSVDLGTQKLKGATCQAQVTVSNGQGSATVMLFSLVSVRTTDGVTVIGSTSFAEGAGTDQLSKDFSAMVNSMLEGQAKG
jgi:hypothetical protein